MKTGAVVDVQARAATVKGIYRTGGTINGRRGRTSRDMNNTEPKKPKRRQVDPLGEGSAGRASGNNIRRREFEHGWQQPKAEFPKKLSKNNCLLF